MGMTKTSIAEFDRYAQKISNPTVTHLKGERVRATVPGACGDITPGRALTENTSQVTCGNCLNVMA